MSKANKAEDKKDQTAGTYTKQQFLSSKQFEDKKDLINTLLKEDKQYTVDQVNKLVDDFLKKEVK